MKKQQTRFYQFRNTWVKKITYFFVCMLLYSSCNKTSQEEIRPVFLEGYVVDAISNDSIPGALVELYEATYGRGGNLLTDYDKRLGSIFTDSTGYFNFYFNASNLLQYGIWTEKEFYVKNDIETFRAGQIHKLFLLKLLPSSWIKFHIRNDWPALPSDQVFIYPNKSFLGDRVDSIFYKEVKANTIEHVYYDISQNGHLNHYYQIMTCASYDTCDFNIYY